MLGFLRPLLSNLLHGAGRVAAGKRALKLSVQHQLQTNWCWAACASSASGLFDPATTWGQCAVVNAELGQSTCCQDGSTGSCNIPWYLDRALGRTGNYRSKSTGAVPLSKVRAEIDAGRPVGARIGWRGGGGHFVMLTGYRQAAGVEEVDVQDPWTGRSSLPIDVFKTNYKSQGTWTHTYLTRK